MVEGIVVRSAGTWTRVATPNHTYDCRLRGKIRLKGIRNTSPVAVGDRVELEITPQHDAIITAIHPRRNYMIRRATNLSKETHIIAANLDLALVVVTLTEPPTLLEFIDRFLATATAYGIPRGLVLTKQDLPHETAQCAQLAIDQTYLQADCLLFHVSARTGEGLDALRAALSGKTTLLAGHSGVGKTSLINALDPGRNLPTAPLSPTYHLGCHTTTSSEMYPLDLGLPSFLIDTPGIKGFGVVDFKTEEIAHFFPDIFRIGQQCQFANCLHLHEPNCAVQKALDQGLLAHSRYQSYCSILLDSHRKYR